jgi:catechol 2,3-dioxygenase-like lactoylglutathione lyase family enzyme
MHDRGLTHVALTVADAERSIDFYAAYADMAVVHRRADEATGQSVVWLSDRTRPFVIVLIEADPLSPALGGFHHLGVAVDSRDEVDRLVARAVEEGRPVVGPVDAGDPVGYWAFVVDPDGHNLELSFGQEVGLTVDGQSRAATDAG